METGSSATQDRTYLERQNYFRGRVKVALDQLRFENEHVPGCRLFEKSFVGNLSRSFETRGCLRLEYGHHIPGLIDDAVLESCLRNGDVSRDALKDAASIPPRLHLEDGSFVLALNGKHRVKATEQFLNADEQWWIVDLFSTSMKTRRLARTNKLTYLIDLPEAINFDLRTEHARGYCDGDVF